MLSAGSLTSGFLSLVARPEPNREVALASTCFCTVLLAVVCWWVALGSRVSLEFSAEGVAVWRGIGRKRWLRWDQARNFRAGYDGGDYFVADPLPDSTWYVHGFNVDDNDGAAVILICNMHDAGFHAATVNAAVRYWKPRPSSRSG